MLIPLAINNRKNTHNSTTPNGRLPERPKLATHGYNNVITTHKRITRKKTKKYGQLQMQSAVGRMSIQNNIKEKEHNMI